MARADRRTCEALCKREALLAPEKEAAKAPGDRPAPLPQPSLPVC